ncbi:hypothetical protein BY458DRAFT_127739 [Sporodiniella umbellata]|nr:hypothetical protein BY458DRAFT_127739 [Sporodiniella umbellata]
MSFFFRCHLLVFFCIKYMANIDRLVEQVISIDSSQSASDIRRDIEYTKSAELTLNRLLDGEFLQGIDNNNSTGDVLVILDSDEEEISPDNLTIDPS